MDRENMSDKQKIEYLEKKYQYNHGTAKAYVEAKGICVYCKEDVLSQRQGYSSAQIEHLLPTSKYPQLKDNLDNLIFCCSSCNSIKYQFDVLKSGENPVEMIQNHRDELIERVREKLADKIKERTIEYQDIRRLLKA